MLMRWLTNNFRFTYNFNTVYNAYSPIFIQTREYAARKGTRERKTKKKVKKVIEKIGFQVPKKVDQKVTTVSPLHMIDDSWKSVPIDNVWMMKYHKREVISFEEAIARHRETQHPTMLNNPSAPVNAFIELNMKREKKNKFVDKFKRIIDTPHIFKEDGTSKVLIFCGTKEQQEIALKAGATHAGGTELIKTIQLGKFPYKEYDHIIAHPNILSDLLLIRGLLKKKFPNIRAGTLSNNITQLVTRFKRGIEYIAVPNKEFKEYASIDSTFGMLDMDLKQLEENFTALIRDVADQKQISTEPFIQRVFIMTASSRERFKINLQEYLPMAEENVEEEMENEGVISLN